MFETLYKTDSPKDFANGEYYQIHLEIEIHDGKQVFFVREKHGWFNDEEKRSAHHIFTLSPQEGFSTLSEAEKAYHQQVKVRASAGFVHSFRFDPWEGLSTAALGGRDR